MFLTTSMKFKVGLLTGIVVGCLLALTAKQIMETAMCVSKEDKTKNDSETEKSDDVAD